MANLPYSVGSQILLRLLEFRASFDRLVLMLQREVAERLAAKPATKAYGLLTVWTTLYGVPRILFVKECPYLDRLCASGADVVSLGKRHDLAAARAAYPGLAFQGNVDQELLRNGTPEQVAAATRSCVAAGGGRRHIVNLNHGVDRATPVANFEAYVRAAKLC